MRLEREKSQYLGNAAMKDSEGGWSQHLAAEFKKEKKGREKKSLNVLIITYNLLL